MLRLHLSQNTGSVCLHSEYPNWTVQYITLVFVDMVRFTSEHLITSILFLSACEGGGVEVNVRGSVIPYCILK